MSTLSNLLAAHTALTGAAVAHLQRVVAEWQLLADLSFADFLLWVPVGDEGAGRFLCVAQCRPTTTATAHPEDMVGTVASASQAPQLERALHDAALRREDQPRWHRGRSVRREVVPVRAPGGEGVVAVLGRDTNLAAPRVPSTLEVSYLAVAADLCQMVADGTFPTAAGRDEGTSTPRVGDGLVRISTSGRVLYASPNAASAFHRLGWSEELVGADLAAVVREVADDAFEGGEAAEHVRGALAGTPSQRAELEGHGASAVLRALPLHPRGVPSGALVLVRDVTEVRRRDRALLSKDATIREIHHRVKNNLQTVAALLRLQARRTPHAEAQEALTESVRRVASIALVHEALAASVDERVDIDEVLDRVLPMMNDLSRPGMRVSMRREGEVGVLPAVMATPLVMVVTELVSNALEHGFAERASGCVVITATRTAATLEVEVRDDGRGLPETFSLERAPGLGLQIVRTLVDSELAGTLSIRPGEDVGTRAVLRVPLQHRGR
ncbi:sensor histidine kinase [Actinomycetospora cinnamomea]|uniref:sensor histidine kinase n=1 Tax=Actinomycetospora cinnamomea TaxID=663609 RepID=UPI000E30E28F|nr:PAS domain-containing sensor histidine kinase [Actinomycetospora cinnamomea]